MALRCERGAGRGLSQGAPSYRNILSSSEPHGKLAEAVWPRVDPETPKPRRTKRGCFRVASILRSLRTCHSPGLRLEPRIQMRGHGPLSPAPLPYMRSAIQE